MSDIKQYIRSVPDFPKKGILFRDITTILSDPIALNVTLDLLYEEVKDIKIDKVVGIESRGFIFGALLAQKLGAGFVPVRKPGKLPSEILTESYELEYGTDTVEIHKDAILPGETVLLHDDLLATGGTSRAAANLVEILGGKICKCLFIIELSFLNGRDKLKDYDVVSLVDYTGEN